jgi:hypothetical protein
MASLFEKTAEEVGSAGAAGRLFARMGLGGRQAEVVIDVPLPPPYFEVSRRMGDWLAWWDQSCPSTLLPLGIALC